MCVLDDGEYCEVWKEREVKARKKHKCSCCCREILVGETYLAHFSKFDGDVSQAALCIECKADRAEFSKAHNGYMPHPDGFDQTLRECIAEGDEESQKQWRPMLARIMAR